MGICLREFQILFSCTVLGWVPQKQSLILVEELCWGNALRRKKVGRARSDRGGRLRKEEFSCRLISARPHRMFWATNVPSSFSHPEAEPSLCASVSGSHWLPTVPSSILGMGHNFPDRRLSLSWGCCACEGGNDRHTWGQCSQQLGHRCCGHIMGIWVGYRLYPHAPHACSELTQFA